jgi:hypothetical protein
MRVGDGMRCWRGSWGSVCWGCVSEDWIETRQGGLTLDPEDAAGRGIPPPMVALNWPELADGRRADPGGSPWGVVDLMVVVGGWFGKKRKWESRFARMTWR